jgi:hypothetical protein
VTVLPPEPSAPMTTIWKPPPARVAYAILSPFGDHDGAVL